MLVVYCVYNLETRFAKRVDERTTKDIDSEPQIRQKIVFFNLLQFVLLILLYVVQPQEKSHPTRMEYSFT